MKQIPLGKSGELALVDDEDYDLVNQWKWKLSNKGYAVRIGYAPYINGKRKRPNILMHRFINKTPDGVHTDHADGNKLNNQRYNLRNATALQNMRNKKAHTTNKISKYKGLAFDKRVNRWYAQIKHDGIRKGCGGYATEIEAAIAYNEAAIKYFGEFAHLNKIERQ